MNYLQKMKKPMARWFAEHLQKYRLGETDGIIGGTGRPSGFQGGSFVASSWSSQPSQDQASGPGFCAWPCRP